MVEVYNDCKAKWQSFEATLAGMKEKFEEINYFHIIGYGGTQDESIEELKEVVAKYIAKVEETLLELKNFNYTPTDETKRKRLEEILKGTPQEPYRPGRYN